MGKLKLFSIGFSSFVISLLFIQTTLTDSMFTRIIFLSLIVANAFLLGFNIGTEV